MPQFFFYIVSNGEIIPDHEGDAFLDLEAAQAEAVAIARDLAREQISERRPLKGVSIEIRDEKGEILAVVDIHEVLDNPEDEAFQDPYGSINAGRRPH
jgi:hypothetical protein